jgi:hypothetical protein
MHVCDACIHPLCCDRDAFGNAMLAPSCSTLPACFVCGPSLTITGLDAAHALPIAGTSQQMRPSCAVANLLYCMYPPLQMPNAYQPVDQLFCVRALYIPIDPSNLNVSLSAASAAWHGLLHVMQHPC